MKELQSPWLHWTDPKTNRSPHGAKTIFEKHGDKLGGELDGANVEAMIVRPSFDPYNDKRIAFLAGKGVREVLRPLFCTMDLNILASLTDRAVMPSSLVTDVQLLREKADAFVLPPAIYAELKRELKQRVESIPGADDTSFPVAVPERGGIDVSYGRRLVEEAKLIDEEFLFDALAVDFTRPIFSGQRCDLVDVVEGKTGAIDAKLRAFASEKTAAKRNAIAKELRRESPELFAGVLEAKSRRRPAEAQLLTHLTDATATADAHVAAATRFIQTCQARIEKGSAASKRAALLEMMTYASHVRRVMRTEVVGFNGQGLLESEDGVDNKLVTDNLDDNSNAFDPDQCRLVLPPNQVKAP